MERIHDFTVNYAPKIEKVKYIVPERIKEARIYRGMTSEEARIACKIESKIQWNRWCNGHEKIPEEIIFNLMSGLRFPKEFFYELKWYRG